MPEWYDALPPRDRPLSSRWGTEEFRAEIRAWCEGIVGPVTSMTQHKLRGWATVWRIETADGVWFAKQNCPGQQIELPLMDALARLAPDRVVPVTAASDGFLLTPDQGDVFYETAGGDLENWVRLAREAALLQRELVPAPRRAARAGDDPATTRGGGRLPRPPGSTSTPRWRPTTHASWPQMWPTASVPTFPSYAGGPRTLRRSACRSRSTTTTCTRTTCSTSTAGCGSSTSATHWSQSRSASCSSRSTSSGRSSRPMATTRGCGGSLTRRWRCGATWSPPRSSAERCPLRSPLGRLGRVESWVRCQPSLSDDELDEWGPVAATWLGDAGRRPAGWPVAGRASSRRVGCSPR